MHPNPVADAAWVFAASEPSKVPFYVAGALLACWAVAIGVTGITRAEFARSTRAAGLVMGCGALLAAATITTAVTTAGPPDGESGAATKPAPGPGSGSSGGSTLALAADPSGDSAYDRTSATAYAGELTVRFTNASPVPHNVTIARGGQVLAQTRTIHDGSSSATADLQAGEYVFYCSVDAHRQAGMEGRLTVR